MPPERLSRWLANFAASHGETRLDVVGGALTGAADDGSRFKARLPFGRSYDGPAGVTAYAEACAPPPDWGLLLVRCGGYAVARLRPGEEPRTKVGRRLVQGRSAAGGWSQQRFARRRAGQARQAYDVAAEHAGRILGGVPVLVTGGDGPGVHEVLTRLDVAPPVGHLPDVGEPRREVLERAMVEARSVRMSVSNA